MENLTFYDLETTGIEVRYDVPVQFAAVRTSSDLTVLEEIEFRGRPPVHVLPAPGALITTGQLLSNLLAAPTTFSEFMALVEGVISGGPASCMVAFNGIRYDEELLRHSFYRALRKPYQTQLDGNCRADAMLLVQAASILCPGTIRVPANERGNPTFKLERLARANGIEATKAHDALADVHMMVELVRVVRDKAPRVWELLSIWTDKGVLERLLKNQDMVLKVECFSGVGRTRSLHPLCANPTYQTEWALIDLALEPATYLSMSSHDLLNAMKPRARLRPILKVKTNAMPLLLEGDSRLTVGFHSVDVRTAKSRVHQIRSDPTFAQRVAEAMTMYREAFDEPVHVEDCLYSGGFFPLIEDEAVIERFHASAPQGKLELLARLHDPRAQQLGERLIYDEWPELLGPSRRAAMEREFFERLANDDVVPWMTAPKALREITKLRIGAERAHIAILDEYEQHLTAEYSRLAAE